MGPVHCHSQAAVSARLGGHFDGAFAANIRRIGSRRGGAIRHAAGPRFAAIESDYGICTETGGIDHRAVAEAGPCLADETAIDDRIRSQCRKRGHALAIHFAGIGDIVPTPYNGAAPGVELQARMLGSLLDANVPFTPRAAPLLLGLLCLLFAGVLFLLATYRERFASAGLPVAGVALPVLALVVHMQLLSSGNVWLGWVAPALYGLIGASVLMLLEQARVRSERSRVFGNLNSYLPSDVAREIAFSLPSSNVNARRSEVTLLSADLRNFSAFGEARPPEESAALLHFFFVRAAEIVEQHGGRIHEFKGDSLLAVWDGHGVEPALLALKAAQDMQVSIYRDMLPQHPPAGLEPLALGIGIEQGPVLIGSIGPSHRRTHTLLGDTVTITLRIQEMTSELAQPILLGECVARQLSDQKLESQGSYLLAGLRTPHVLFAPAIAEANVRRLRQDQVPLTVVSGGRR